MRTLDTYLGMEPFGVEVDFSPQLRRLAERAKQLREEPFDIKFHLIKSFTWHALANAYEQMIVWENKRTELTGVETFDENGNPDDSEYSLAVTNHERYKSIVFEEHPLSHALEEEAGCCRYQAALFFVLAYEADLGDRHFIQVAPVNDRANTVYNELVKGGKSQEVSIFSLSLVDQSLDYLRQNPELYKQTFTELVGRNFYSYHRTDSGLVIVENPTRHVMELN